MVKNSLLSVWQNELFKIFKKHRVKMIMLLLLSAVTVLPKSLEYWKLRAQGQPVPYPLGAFTLAIFVYFYIPVFVVFICTDIFSGEYSDGTIKITLLAPVSRLKVFVGKFLAVLTFIACMLLVGFVFSVLEYTADIKAVFGSGGLFFIIALSYVSAMLPISVFALMSIVVSNLFENTNFSFLLIIVLSAVFLAIDVFYPRFSFVFSFMDFNFPFHIISGRSILGAFNVIISLVGYLVLFFSIAYSLFENKEI